MSKSYKETYSFEKRATESANIREKYASRIPIICEKLSSSDVKEIDKKKYLVPNELTAGQFLYVIRKRIQLPPEGALFLSMKNTIPPAAEMLSSLYQKHKDADGFLYITYASENTFG
ncbi:MAG: hypothetical protein Sylvanvirus1_89 [Sylvanvirus sp.]|uniref:Autophagy-related protein n=1 Tax=Sylvanvirus sp. TaxID=2487774 RepID=A0A3G5AK34_9VIRU|nr:MAG: hypothetical protein Sylvanvirus1_89 [Sylvanvirus sp.]